MQDCYSRLIQFQWLWQRRSLHPCMLLAYRMQCGPLLRPWKQYPAVLYTGVFFVLFMVSRDLYVMSHTPVKTIIPRRSRYSMCNDLSTAVTKPAPLCMTTIHIPFCTWSASLFCKPAPLESAITNVLIPLVVMSVGLAFITTGSMSACMIRNNLIPRSVLLAIGQVIPGHFLIPHWLQCEAG